MELLIAAAIAGGFVALTTHLMRRSRRHQLAEERQRLLDQPIREIEELQTDDVLLFERQDFVVTEAWEFEASGRRWVEASMQDASVVRWVVVDPADEEGICWGEEVQLPGLGDQPSEAIDYHGEIFQLTRHGTAERHPPETQALFWDYAQPGASRLWIRQHEELRRVFVGERVPRHLVDFLPGT